MLDRVPLTFCYICYEKGYFPSDNTDFGLEIVSCIKCNSRFHYRCAGLFEQISGKIPIKNYVCVMCSLGSQKFVFIIQECEICRQKKGYMICTSDNKWIHPICALNCPSYYIIDPLKIKYERVKTTKHLNILSKPNICLFCHTKLGFQIQCGGKECKKSIHLFCLMDYIKENLLKGITVVQWEIKFALLKNQNQDILPEFLRQYIKDFIIDQEDHSNSTDLQAKRGGGKIEILCPDHSQRSKCYICQIDKTEKLLNCIYCEYYFHTKCAGMSFEDSCRYSGALCPCCKDWVKFKLTYLISFIHGKNQNYSSSVIISPNHNDKRKYNDILLYLQAWEKQTQYYLNNFSTYSNIYNHIGEFTRCPWTFTDSILKLLNKLFEGINFDKEKIKPLLENIPKISIGNQNILPNELENYGKAIDSYISDCTKYCKLSTKGMEIAKDFKEKLSWIFQINLKLEKSPTIEEVIDSIQKMKSLKCDEMEYKELNKIVNDYKIWIEEYNSIYKIQSKSSLKIEEIDKLFKLKFCVLKGINLLESSKSIRININDQISKLNGDIQECQKWDKVIFENETISEKMAEQLLLKANELIMLPECFEKIYNDYKNFTNWENLYKKITNSTRCSLTELDNCISLYSSIYKLSSEKINHLKKIKLDVNEWEKRVNEMIKSSETKNIRKEIEFIQGLGIEHPLCKDLQKKEDFINQMKMITSKQNNTTLDDLYQYLSKSKLENLDKKLVSNIEKLIVNAKQLQESIKEFLSHNAHKFQNDDYGSNLVEEVKNCTVTFPEINQLNNLLNSKKWFYECAKSIGDNLEGDYLSALMKHPIDKIKFLNRSYTYEHEPFGPALNLKYMLDFIEECEELKLLIQNKLKISEDKIKLITKISNYKVLSNCPYKGIVDKAKEILLQYIELIAKCDRMDLTYTENTNKIELKKELEELIFKMKNIEIDLSSRITKLSDKCTQLDLFNNLMKRPITEEEATGYLNQCLILNIPKTHELYLNLLNEYNNFKVIKDFNDSYINNQEIEFSEFSEIIKKIESCQIKAPFEQLKLDYQTFLSYKSNIINEINILIQKEEYSREEISKIEEIIKSSAFPKIIDKELNISIKLLEWKYETILEFKKENISYDKAQNFIKRYSEINSQNNLVKYCKNSFISLSLALQSSEEISKEIKNLKSSRLSLEYLKSLKNRLKSLKTYNSDDVEAIDLLIKQSDNLLSEFNSFKQKKPTIQKLEEFKNSVGSFNLNIGISIQSIESDINRAKNILKLFSLTIKEFKTKKIKIPIRNLVLILEDYNKLICLIPEIEIVKENINSAKILLKNLNDKFNNIKEYLNWEIIEDIKSQYKQIEFLFEDEDNLPIKIWRCQYDIIDKKSSPSIVEIKSLVYEFPETNDPSDQIKKEKLDNLMLNSGKHIQNIKSLANIQDIEKYELELKAFPIDLTEILIEQRQKLIINNSKNELDILIEKKRISPEGVYKSENKIEISPIIEKTKNPSELAPYNPLETGIISESPRNDPVQITKRGEEIAYIKDTLQQNPIFSLSFDKIDLISSKIENYFYNIHLKNSNMYEKKIKEFRNTIKCLNQCPNYSKKILQKLEIIDSLMLKMDKYNNLSERIVKSEKKFELKLGNKPSKNENPIRTEGKVDAFRREGLMDPAKLNKIEFRRIESTDVYKNSNLIERTKEHNISEFIIPKQSTNEYYDPLKLSSHQSIKQEEKEETPPKFSNLVRKLDLYSKMEDIPSNALPGALLKIWDGLIDIGKVKFECSMYSTNSIKQYQSMPRLNFNILLEGNVSLNDIYKYILSILNKSSYLLLSGWIVVNNEFLETATEYSKSIEMIRKGGIIELREIKAHLYIFSYNEIELLNLLKIKHISPSNDDRKVCFGYAISYKKEMNISPFQLWNPIPVEPYQNNPYISKMQETQALINVPLVEKNQERNNTVLNENENKDLLHKLFREKIKEMNEEELKIFLQENVEEYQRPEIEKIIFELKNENNIDSIMIPQNAPPIEQNIEETQEYIKKTNEVQNYLYKMQHFYIDQAIQIMRKATFI